MIDYRKELRDNSEPEYAAFASKLIPGKKGIIGVRVPTMRRIAKEIVKDDWESYLDDDTACFEEEFLRGLVIATAPMDSARRIRLTEGYLDLIDNWSTCDMFCTSWKVPDTDRELIWDYFSSLMVSGEEFKMRVSIVFMMTHFMDDDHIEAIIDAIATCRNDGFYYRMGAAWCLSVCFVHFRERILEELGSGRLDPWVQNKAIQKIRESLRVSDEDKEIVSKYRL